MTLDRQKLILNCQLFCWTLDQTPLTKIARYEIFAKSTWIIIYYNYTIVHFVKIPFTPAISLVYTATDTPGYTDVLTFVFTVV